jgi:CheY-like chemotaxis protein
MTQTSRKLMILIADDNPQIRQTIKDVLNNVSAQFYECSDGSKALELYRRHRPHWVLMDIKMPGMDGITATRMIRKSFPEARIVIVTNYDDLMLRKDAQDAGAMGFVTKDDLSVLQTMVSQGL